MSHGEGGGGGDERWLISYADFITLLLAFFIILYSMAEADKEKFKQLGMAFAQTFGVVGFQGGGAILEGSGSGGSSEVFTFGSLPSEQRQFMGVSEELEEYVADNNLGNQIAVNVRNEGIAITPGHLFSTGDRYRNFIRLNAANWSDEAIPAIQRLGRVVSRMVRGEETAPAARQTGRIDQGQNGGKSSLRPS